MHAHPDTVRFNFDRWKNLCAVDPEGFERVRRAVVEAQIARAPAERRARLEALQWRVDRVRERAGSPLGACLRLSQLMWQTVLRREGLLRRIEALQSSPEALPPLASAQVISLQQARRREGPSEP